MTRFSKIVVGVKPPSTCSGRVGLEQPVIEAISTAISLAESNRHCQVTFASVCASDAEQDDVMRSLDRVCPQFHAAGISTDIALLSGRTAECLLSVSHESSADLIIVGSRPASKADRVLIGSTAMRLYQSASVPIWCAKPGRIGLEWIVCVADDLKSSLGEDLLDCGVELALHRHAGLVAAHAIESDETSDEVLEQRSRELLNRLAMTDFRSVPRGVRPHLAVGQATDVIQDAVDEYDVDLLIIGLTSENYPGIGDTPMSLLPQLHCSVLGIPAERST